MSKSASSKDVGLVIGGMPKADLLPPEIKAGERARAQRRGLLAIFVLAVVVVGAGYLGANILAESSRAALALANSQTGAILAEQAQFAEVSEAQQGVDAVEAARMSAMSTEIDWGAQLDAVNATVPDGATLTALTVVSTSPVTPIDLPTSPLEGGRVAELTLTIETAELPDTAKWVEDLSLLSGFVDATPTSIISDQGVITVVVTLHLNSEIYWNRFAATEETE